MEKRPRKVPISVLLIWFVALIALVFCSTVFKTVLIASFNIRIYSLIRSILCGVAIGATLIPGYYLFLALRHSLKQRLAEAEQRAHQKQEQTGAMQKIADGNLTPEEIRGRLNDLVVEYPKLEPTVDACLAMMSKVDRFQKKQEDLINNNRALYLKDTVTALNRTEQKVWQNIQKICNLCIAAGEFDEIDLVEIDDIVRHNEKILVGIQKLTKASAEWINNYKSGEEDRSELEHWIDVINQRLEEG